MQVGGVVDGLVLFWLHLDTGCSTGVLLTQKGSGGAIDSASAAMISSTEEGAT